MTVEGDVNAIAQAAGIIRSGGVAAFPTETVYGLGADALNPTAVARIFEIKRRPFFDPLIVHVDSIERARSLSESWTTQADDLTSRFWPGPLTVVVCRRPDIVPDIVTSDLPTVAIRMPSHDIAQRLLRAAATPIAAPSANRFGSVSPTTAEHVRDSLGSDVDFVLDGGACESGVESTIVSVASEADPPMLLRPGALPVEEIEAVVGPLRRASDAERLPDQPEAPGMLASHYATRTPLALLDAASTMALQELIDSHGCVGIGGICLGSQQQIFVARGIEHVEVLSITDDLREAASNLFAAMRRLDAAPGIRLILACPVSNEGLGLAINDRLKRASSLNR